MKPQYTLENFSSSQNKLAMHQDSHTITKCKPKIRIIHIYAPEIIKTDVEHFRELVQKLTGKPTHQDQIIKGKTKKSSTRDLINQCPKPIITKNIIAAKIQDDHHQIQMLQSITKMKKETEEIFGGNDQTSSNSYLHGFTDMDCFNIQDLVEYPLLSYKSSSSQMNTFGEMSFASNRLC